MSERKVKQPSKQQTREWLANEIRLKRPPPSPEEINRELGRHLIDAERTTIHRPPK